MICEGAILTARVGVDDNSLSRDSGRGYEINDDCPKAACFERREQNDVVCELEEGGVTDVEGCKVDEVRDVR